MTKLYLPWCCDCTGPDVPPPPPNIEYLDFCGDDLVLIPRCFELTVPEISNGSGDLCCPQYGGTFILIYKSNCAVWETAERYMTVDVSGCPEGSATARYQLVLNFGVTGWQLIQRSGDNFQGRNRKWNRTDFRDEDGRYLPPTDMSAAVGFPDSCTGYPLVLTLTPAECPAEESPLFAGSGDCVGCEKRKEIMNKIIPGSGDLAEKVTTATGIKDWWEERGRD